jgi:acid phosphatase (class A)
MKGIAMGAGRIRRIAGLALVTLVVAIQAAGATPREVLLLRHGHKDIGRGDYNLSPQGLARMEAMARVIPACFGAPTQLRVYPFDRLTGKNSRSYQSAVPLAVATGLPITLMEAAATESEQEGRSILTDPSANSGRLVMIWEHRRLPDLARGLGWDRMAPIADDDFDRLDLLRYSPGSATPTVERYSQTRLLNDTCARDAEGVNPAAGVVLNPEPLQRLIGAPPRPGSLAEQEDLAVLRWLQRTRSPQQVAASWILLDREISLFNISLGTDLPRSAPLLVKGVASFLAPVSKVKDQIKETVRRPRPFVDHADLIPCLPREDNFSYPSGHSTWYRAAAELLADLLPARRERLHWIGRQGGFNRSLCGVHYPSDVAAGQLLGATAAQQVIQTGAWQRFRQDPRVQAEVRAILAIREGDLPPLVH